MTNGYQFMIWLPARSINSIYQSFQRLPLNNVKEQEHETDKYFL